MLYIYVWPRFHRPPADKPQAILQPQVTLFPVQPVDISLQAVLITVPLSYRICDECLVPYFDSSSPDSRNVSLVPAGCVLVLFTHSTPPGWFLLINMKQEQNTVP